MITIEPFGSHLAPLVGCVASTSGRVLELGSGVFSTPVLHAACQGRELVTVDGDLDWMRRFLYLESPAHRFELVEDWSTLARLDEEWDVALVDHSPGHVRTDAISRLRARTRFIVVHDTNEVAHYGFEPLLSSFRHREDFLELGLPVRTTVVSDHAPVPLVVPALDAGHRFVALSPAPVRLRPTGTQWGGPTFPFPVDTGHFFLSGRVLVNRPGDDLLVQAVFLDAQERELFFMSLLPGPAQEGDGTFGIAQEAAKPVAEEHRGGADADWSAVCAVQVRANATDAAVTIRGFGLRSVARPPLAAQGPSIAAPRRRGDA